MPPRRLLRQLVYHHDELLRVLRKLESRARGATQEAGERGTATVPVDELQGQLETLVVAEDEVLESLGEEASPQAARLADLIGRHRTRRRRLGCSIADAARVCTLDLLFCNALRGLIRVLRGLVAEQRRKLQDWPTQR